MSVPRAKQIRKMGARPRDRTSRGAVGWTGCREIGRSPVLRRRGHVRPLRGKRSSPDSGRYATLRRDEINGLYNAFHFENLKSYVDRGVLSHRRAAAISHRSIADEAVQSRRETIVVPPSGRRLHTYANLYFNPRNIVGYRFKWDNRDAGGTDDDLCMVRVTLAVLDLPGVIVTDRNAASLPRWMAPETGLAALDHDDLFATHWSGNKDHAQRMCAEVLVPDLVPPEYIDRVYVATPGAKAAAEALCPAARIAVKGALFFR